jgi:acyl-coenzyme A synthetase/AMP-(fatty) acid ligase
MFIDFLASRFQECASDEALVWRESSVCYGELSASVERSRFLLAEAGVTPNSVVTLEADFAPAAVALLLALIENGCIVVPIASSIESRKSEFREIAEAEWQIRVSRDNSIHLTATGQRATHPLLLELKRRGHPGLILFSSGTTGKSKAAVHDFVQLLEKFQVRREAHRMAAFLSFDHIGGINTLLFALSNGGCAVLLEDRSPQAVCAAVEKHRIAVLPTSPTFLNLLLLSDGHRAYDLSSLRLLTYGTEVMPESTLQRVAEEFPSVRLQQTYGLSEVGILRSKSKSSRSLWVKVGGEGYEIRVVDGLLEIKAKSAMLGYLNAPSPFTADGWLQTGDAVEIDRDYIRIMGRRGEMINVGGEKVYPAEVENHLQSMPGVEDVVVAGEPNPITGQIVVARIRLSTGESAGDFRKRMHAFCRERLPRYKIPARIEIVPQQLHTERYKKMRSAALD